jgi:hypothetical protein
MFKYQRGRVIGLGRAMLSILFLMSIWLDNSQPAKAPAQTYGLLLLYAVLSLATAAATWRNWWLDARLAAPAHILDMAVFTGVVFSTHGYTSPFFLFFILPLLSAAIRWSWRETALTAACLIILYMTAGLLVSGSEAFELQRFIVRTGHLFILSALLIWFGVHQRFTRLFFRVDEVDAWIGRADEPLAQALGLAMAATHARAGALLLQSPTGSGFSGIRISADQPATVAIDGRPMDELDCGAALFDLDRR